MNSNIDENINNIKSITSKLDGLMLPYRITGIPSTIHMLNILLPIMLPNNKSCSPFLEDTIVVINSGSDVPKAMIVSDIIRSLKPISKAILDAL